MQNKAKSMLLPYKEETIFPLLEFSPPLESCFDSTLPDRNSSFKCLVPAIFHLPSLSIIDLLISVLCTQIVCSLLSITTRHAPYCWLAASVFFKTVVKNVFQKSLSAPLMYLRFKGLVVHVLAMFLDADGVRILAVCGRVRELSDSIKNILICGFVTTWGCVINDRIFIFVWPIPLIFLWSFSFPNGFWGFLGRVESVRLLASVRCVFANWQPGVSQDKTKTFGHRINWN